MAESTTESSAVSSGAENAVDGVQTAVSFVVSMLKWLVLLNVAAAWVVFWGNLVRLHVTMGQLPNAVVTVLLFFGPVVVAGGWWVDQKLGLRESTAGAGEATGRPS